MLQLISFYPLLELPFSSNNINFFYTLHRIVTFDFLPDALKRQMTTVWFDFPRDITFTPRYKFFGYQHGQVIAVLLAPLWFIFFASLYFLTHYLRYLIAKDDTVKAELKKKLAIAPRFYLRVYLELSLPILIISLPEAIMKQSSTGWETVSYLLSMALLFVIARSIKILWKFINKNYRKIKLKRNKEFNLKWEILFKEFTFKHGPPIFPVLFLVRRIAVAVVIVLLPLMGVHPLGLIMTIIGINLA